MTLRGQVTVMDEICVKVNGEIRSSNGSCPARLSGASEGFATLTECLSQAVRCVRAGAAGTAPDTRDGGVDVGAAEDDSVTVSR